MNLQQARALLRGGGTGQLSRVIQALLVVLAHARQEHDSGDLRFAKDLVKDAERGMQVADRCLRGWYTAGGWRFIREGYENAEDVASEVVTKIWVAYMKGKNPPSPEAVAGRHPRELMSWVITIARNLAIDKDKFYFPDSSPQVPVLPPLPGPVQQALSAELQVGRDSILARTLHVLERFVGDRPTVLGGQMKMADFIKELVNYRVGEHGLVKAILDHTVGPIRPSEVTVRQAVHEVREQLASRLAWLPGDWEDWCERARAEGFHIREDASRAGPELDQSSGPETESGNDHRDFTKDAMPEISEPKEPVSDSSDVEG